MHSKDQEKVKYRKLHWNLFHHCLDSSYIDLPRERNRTVVIVGKKREEIRTIIQSTIGTILSTMKE